MPFKNILEILGTILKKNFLPIPNYSFDMELESYVARTWYLHLRGEGEGPTAEAAQQMAAAMLLDQVAYYEMPWQPYHFDINWLSDFPQVPDIDTPLLLHDFCEQKGRHAPFYTCEEVIRPMFGRSNGVPMHEVTCMVDDIKASARHRFSASMARRKVAGKLIHKIMERIEFKDFN